MEPFGGSGFSGVTAVKRRRTATSRRPRPDSQFVVENRDQSPPSSTPSSDNATKVSSDDNTSYAPSFPRKEFSLNSSSQKVASINKIEGLGSSKKIRREDRKFGDVDALYRSSSSRGSVPGHGGSELRRSSEGVLSLANWKSNNKARENIEMQARSPDGHVGRNGDGYGMGQSAGGSNGSAESKQLKKVKLKVGGVVRTIHAKSNSETGNTIDSSSKTSRSSDSSRHRQKLILPETSDDEESPTEKGNSTTQVMAWKDFGGGFSRGTKVDSRGKITEGSLSMKEVDKSQSVSSSEPTRKSKRVPKKRVLDGAFDEVDEDDEIRYLERLKMAKVTRDYSAENEDDEEDSLKKKKISKVSKSKRIGYDIDEDYVSRSGKDNRRRSKSGKESDDADYMEEDEPGSDTGLEAKKKKQKEPVDALTDSRAEPLTTRQRALQSSKDGSTGSSLVEFPNGLPPAPPRKQKEKLSEVELQAKKAEAAQRRRMQVEKANRELEAATISKILGQDPKKKKKEEEKLKELDEKAQERAANFLTLAPNTVRWIIGPTGTVVTFADDVGLPIILDSKPCSYPPPREKCAGPSCTNTYKYRDSKSNLPLCSLQCYRAIQEHSHSVSTC
ncbi:putative INO80 complex subunit B-like region, Zinc finger, HIT-type, INO80 complex, subunit Ies2 [Dioscorea sansibarensis]